MLLVLDQPQGVMSVRISYHNLVLVVLCATDGFYGYLVTLVFPVVQVETVNRGGQEHVYTNRLIIPMVRGDHAGKYICVVTSAAGNMVYKAAFLDVLDGELPSLTHLLEHQSSITFVSSTPHSALAPCDCLC